MGKHVQQSYIGLLTDLQTTDKSNVVAAINEMKANSGKTKVNSYVWSAVANQTVFTIGTGSYIPNSGNMEVHVGGKVLISGTDYTETSPTTFTLLTITDLEAGDTVYAKWFENVNLSASSTVVEDNLTSSSNSNALSANQGKQLNNKIGNLSNLNTTTKTDVVSAINEVNNKNQTKVNQQYWTASVGQKVFNITSPGNYIINKGNIQVFVGGIALVSGQDYTETSNTSFTLTNSDLDGEIVFAKWFELVSVVASSTVVEDVLTSTNNLNALSANQGRILNEQLMDVAINVKSFGAKGDGITDDTVSIQNAINQAAPTKVNIVIPSGNYKLTAPLILKTGTRIQMSNNAKLLRYHNDCLFQNGVAGDIQGQSDIVVSGGQLDLRGHILNTSNSMDGTGFALGYAKNITIRDVDIYNVFYSHGMELCALENVLVERCGLYGFKIDSGGTRTNAEAIQIERGTLTGFPYFGSGDNTICKNIKIIGCKFGASADLPAWNLAIGSHAGDVILSADNVEIIGNITVDPMLTKIMQLKGYKNVTLERNVMTATHGVEIYDDGTFTKVKSLKNKFTATTNEAIYLSGVDGFNSEGNVYDGYTNAVALVNSCKNIKLLLSDDLYGQTSDAFNAQATSSYFFVDGVTIRKSGRHAFNIFGGCSHFKVINCMILDVADTANAFNFAGSNTKIGDIRGNHIVDTTLVNVVAATSGMDRLYFNNNIYSASIVTPINSTATNSDTTGNRTF